MQKLLLILKDLQDKPVRLTAFVSILSQVSRPLVSLITIPLFLNLRGQEDLGVWMIALSFMGLIGFFNAGVSTAVITAIGRASGTRSPSELSRETTAATIVTLFLGLFTLCLTPLVFLVNWGELFNVKNSTTAAEIQPMMLALVLLLAVGFTCALPRSVMFGRNHGYWGATLDILGAWLGAGALIILLFNGAPLWALISSFLFFPYLTYVVGGLIYFSRSGIQWVSRQHYEKETLVNIRNEGLQMSAYQAAYAISSQSDLLLIGAFLGAEESAVYGIASRLFALPVLICTAVNYAQWPEMARLDALGERDKTMNMLRKTILIGTGITTFVAIMLAIAYQPIVTLWLGKTVPAGGLLLMGLVCWVFILTMVNSTDVLLRARNDTRFIMWCMIAMACTNIVLTVILLKTLGIAGAIWGTVIGFALTVLFPYIWRIVKSRPISKEAV